MILILPLLLGFNSCHKVEAADDRKIIMVIDTGVSPEIAAKPYMCERGNITFATEFDEHGHGSNVVDLIGSRIDDKKYCILSINAWTGGRFVGKYKKGLKMAVKLKNLVAINLSMSSPHHKSSYYGWEVSLIRKLLKKGVKINAAAGNDYTYMNKENCHVYPACLKYNFQYKDGTFNPNIKVIASHVPRYLGTFDLFNYEHTKFRHHYTQLAKKDKGVQIILGKKKGIRHVYDYYSNDGPHVDAHINGSNQGIDGMSGTSQSTAIYTGMMFSE